MDYREIGFVTRKARVKNFYITPPSVKTFGFPWESLTRTDCESTAKSIF